MTTPDFSIDHMTVAFAIDGGLVEQLCVTLHSLLRHRGGTTDVLLLAVDLKPDEIALIEKTASLFARATLRVQPFSLGSDDLMAISSGHLTATSLARIFLPDYIEERVLYLDADILVLEDLGPLFRMEMFGHVIAAARDLPQLVNSDVLDRAALGEVIRPRDLRRAQKDITGFHNALPWGDPAHYVNTGVLLIDCAAMRADKERYAQLRNVAEAAQYPLLDQDHINRTYGAEKTLLPLRWNRLTGNIPEGMYQRYLAAQGAPDDAAIYHYAGMRKPWWPWWKWRASRAPAKMLRWRLERWLMRRKLKGTSSFAIAKQSSAHG